MRLHSSIVRPAELTRKLRNQRTKLFFSLVIREKKKNVQVGIRKQHPTAVAAKSQQAESFTGGIVKFKRVLEDALNHAVGKFAQSVKRFPCTRAAFKFLAYA